MTSTLLQVPEIHCDHCKSSLESAVSALEGVDRVEVAIANATLDVDYNETEVGLDVIKTTIEDQGYAVFG